jgi:putative membrane protein
VLGIAMIVIAGVRFAKTAKDIDTDRAVASPGERFDLALAALLGLLGIALFLYMAHAVLPSL